MRSVISPHRPTTKTTTRTINGIDDSGTRALSVNSIANIK